MDNRRVRAFRVHSCERCGGDAYLDRAEDPPDWRCLQCGRLIEKPDFDVRGALVEGLEPAA